MQRTITTSSDEDAALALLAAVPRPLPQTEDEILVRLVRSVLGQFVQQAQAQTRMTIGDAYDKADAATRDAVDSALKIKKVKT